MTAVKAIRRFTVRTVVPPELEPLEELAALLGGAVGCSRVVTSAGWRPHSEQVGQTGSHRQFKHPTLPGRVTVAGKPGDDVAPGTLGSILKQAGIKR